MSQRSALFIITVGLVILSSACSGSQAEAPANVVNTETPILEVISPTLTGTVQIQEKQPTRTPRPFSPAQGGSWISDKNDFFAASGNCVACHKQNIDQAGNDVSIGEYWRSTMMANAAIDPYYLAGISMNIDHFPEYGTAIESKCSTCHMPMAHFSDLFNGAESLIFGPEGYLDHQNPLHKLASDGVSCTACHQIQDEGMGDFSSFSGGFVIDNNAPMGARTLFGRFDLQQSSQNMMSNSSGFTSQKSEHLAQSELCATCHDLYTQYVTEDGTFSEEWFPEQTPYSEWLNSDYATRSTCQDCHMPLAEGSVVLSNMGPGGPRSPFAKHSFVGGNAYMLDILKNFGGELGVQASAEHFDATIERTLTQLQTNTAELTISPPVLEDSLLSFDVSINSFSGHKLPTGYPSRRAWLHVRIEDENGQLIFESGAVEVNGAIIGNENDQNALAFEAHYNEITRPDQVQIYESIMHDVSGKLTTVLLSASSYSKDNRLLPAGFDKTSVTNAIAPAGNALTDGNFTGGGDSVTYLIDTGNTAGPFLVDVEFLYQSISYRWAEDLSAYNTQQSNQFTDYYNTLSNLPVILAVQTVQSD